MKFLKTIIAYLSSFISGMKVYHRAVDSDLLIYDVFSHVRSMYKYGEYTTDEANELVDKLYDDLWELAMSRNIDPFGD